MESKMRNIEIDFDVHKVIETERVSFSETPNAVLRRLLGIKGKKASPNSLKILEQEVQEKNQGKPWAGKGVALPHGTLLKATYNGVIYDGRIVDGHWFVEGRCYSSPSGALGAIARTKRGGKTKLDGWEYWQVKRSQDTEWLELKSLRSNQYGDVTLADLGL